MTRFEFAGLRFEWDEDKAQRNLEKHGLAFVEAAEVFLDDNALFEISYSVASEVRFRVIGEIRGSLIAFVAYTEREHDDKESLRIISARKASKNERSRYLDARRHTGR